MVKISLKNQNIIQVNFLKLHNRSNYLRDEYKFLEALSSIQTEIDEIERTLETKDESIIQFFQLIEDSVVDILIEQYKDIYAISQYFCIPKFIDELDNIKRYQLYYSNSN